MDKAAKRELDAIEKLSAKGRWDDAIARLEVLRPDEPELKTITMRNLAYLYWSTGREDKARELYGRLPDGDEGFLEFLSGMMRPYLEPAIPV